MNYVFFLNHMKCCFSILTHILNVNIMALNPYCFRMDHALPSFLDIAQIFLPADAFLCPSMPPIHFN